MDLVNDPLFKVCRSEEYNYIFRKADGFFARWGKTKDHDPQQAPFPEILDMEISVGDCSSNCSWCYKSNSRGNGIHMNLDTFKNIIDKMGFLTQIAFGITDIDSNPDFIGMLHYAREKGIVPNFTMAGYGLTETLADQVAGLCGAIAVSAYPHTRNLAYNTIKSLTDRGMKQVNIHLLYYSGNEEHVYQVLKDVKNDPRLAKLNAVVLLGLKTKGRAEEGFQALSYEKFSKIIEHCFDEDVPIGFDSCSAPKFEEYVNTSDMPKKQKENLLQMSEPCESTLFSFYINYLGEGFPCSFMESTLGWEKGINVLDADNFVEDVWNHPRIVNWRQHLLEKCRHCPVYKV